MGPGSTWKTRPSSTLWRRPRAGTSRWPNSPRWPTRYWRGLDIDSLHQQSVYARQENLKTEGENQSVLAGADGAKMRNQLCETFRIAYGMGLLDSALAFLFVKR